MRKFPGPPSCDLNAPRSGTRARVLARCSSPDARNGTYRVQVHGWASSTTSLPVIQLHWIRLITGSLIPLHVRSFSSVQMFHTHTPQSGEQSWGPDHEVKMRMQREMKMRWKWKWNECYLTRTRDGERQKGEEEPRKNTNTNRPGPERANPEKARKKQKRRPTEENPDRRRGGRTEAPEPTWTPAKTKPT